MEPADNEKLSLSEKFYSSKDPKFKYLGETELSCKKKKYIYIYIYICPSSSAVGRFHCILFITNVNFHNYIFLWVFLLSHLLII